MSALEHDLDRIVKRTQSATDAWGQLPSKTRVRHLRSVRHQIVKNQDELIESISQDTKKPVTEVASQEITAVLAMLRFIEKNYPKWLRGHRFRDLTPGFWTKSNTVSFDPLGVIAVIGPANFPFSLVMIQAAAALACGNGVIIKPSERCPITAQLIRRLFDATSLPDHVVEVLEGPPETGARLVVHPTIRKVLFTGSSESGARVAEKCGKYFKPCVLELGGEGPAIVCEEADLQLTARGILWSTLYANGQSCIGTRRVLVLPGVTHDLMSALSLAADRCQIGDPDEPDTEVVTTHTLQIVLASADAIPDTKTDAHLPRTIHESASYNGVRLNIQEVSSLEEAVYEVNNSPFGLSASIWCSDARKAKRIANRLRVGMVWVNDASVALPRFPWGGIRRSGWGRLFSKEALPELTHVKVVSHDHRRTALPKFWWFPYSKKKFDLIFSFNAFFYGPRKWKVFRLLIAAVRRYIFYR